VQAHPAIRPDAFIRYKFLNSLFLGLSVGAVFVLYTPLSPAVFSAGGFGLALATLVVATQYRRILTPFWFFSSSLLVELVTLSGIAAVVLFPVETPLALFVYVGYQITFSLGNYLVRCETLLMVNASQLARLDVAKQFGYIIGMGAAWIFYSGLETLAGVANRIEQVVALHYVLIGIELLVLLALWRAFRVSELRSDAPPLAP
jgi:putative membrane protein